MRSGRLAANLLDRKVAILRIEQQRWRQADVWAVRTALVGGERELRLSAPAEPVEVTIAWATVMGVRYPTGAECLTPPLPPADRPGPSPTDG